MDVEWSASRWVKDRTRGTARIDKDVMARQSHRLTSSGKAGAQKAIRWVLCCSASQCALTSAALRSETQDQNAKDTETQSSTGATKHFPQRRKGAKITSRLFSFSLCSFAPLRETFLRTSELATQRTQSTRRLCRELIPSNRSRIRFVLVFRLHSCRYRGFQ
jgi:hypothetical protein